VSGPVVVLGPTASGKSDVAMAAAMAVTAGGSDRVEIVAVDAMQVYRGMDIGTAKPTSADRAAVAHHAIDLVGPDQDFTVAEFAAAADAAIADIERRGRRPLLVAGTGLYLRAITDPMEMPGVWPAVRAELEARLDQERPEVLHAELARLDPVAAARIEPGNGRRTVRALEVCLGSGRPFSSYGPGLDSYPPSRFVQIGLRWSRAELARRIEARVHQMMAGGLLAEVTMLAAGPPLSRTARQALGYKELLEHLDGRVSLDQAVDMIILRTRQFAVRQERWFRRDPRIQWVDIHDDPVAEVVPVVLEVIAR
jgi:tRNA dimethylallyltransferase